MSQPPLSAAIGRLERKLGVRLLERTSRRVALTPAGAVLLQQGRVAVEGLAAAIERTRRKGIRGDRLTVAIKPGMDADLLKMTMQLCSHDDRIPEIHVLFGHPGGPAAALRSGAADVAIARTPFDARGLDTELLLVEPRVAALPAGHPLAARHELHRADLAGEPMPHWTGRPDPATTAYWTGTDISTAHPRGHQPDPETPPGPEINDITQLLDAVAIGNAVAYVPLSLADRHRTDLTYLPVIDLTPCEVVAAWPDTCRSTAVAGFVRAAAKAAADRLPSAFRQGCGPTVGSS